MTRWLTVLVGISSVAQARSLSLSDAVQQALRVDPLVAEARIGEDRSKLAVLRSQLDRFSFKVDGQLQELWNKTNIGGPKIYDGAGILASDQSPSAGQGLFNISANLNVPVFSGLRVEGNVARAQRLEKAAHAGLRVSRKDTALSVARAYWSVRRVSLLKEVQTDALARMQEAESVTAGRVKAGLAPPIDQNRARLRKLQQVSTLADLDGQYRQAAAQLAVALELPGDIELTDAPDVSEQAPPPVESLLTEARDGRPEIKQARAQAESQHYAVWMARSTFFPQLNAFGLYQFGNNPYILGSGARATSDATNPFANLAGNLTLGATLSVNFFDTLNTYTSTKDAKYEEARLIEEARRFQRVVDSDVRVAHAKVIQLQTQRASLLEARDVARDNLKILEARYKNGDALVIEFLDAQVDLANAELNLADVTARLKLAALELEAALGKTVGVES